MAMIDKNTCEHDYDNPTRIGRACWVCPLCGEDISLIALFIAEAEADE